MHLAVKFLKKYDPCHELRTIRPVTPYPGCRLYKEAIEKGFLEGPEDFYERKHVNSDLISVNFMDISTDMAHSSLHKANYELLKNYYEKRKNGVNDQMIRIYYGNPNGFRGFRAV